MAASSPDTQPFNAEPPVVTTGGLPSIGGYVVIELVGRGGMGKVYRARHVQLGRVVAIKVMTQEHDERLAARFRDEARAVAKLQHPNIAQLYDTGTADGRPYYSLEFADGGTLAGKWDGKPQDPTAAAAVMESVARAIQHSHEHGILHRDLKPGNVLLAADGTPKVADFGLAKELPSLVPGATTTPGLAAHTRTGEIVGTPAYMPPEQASGINSSLTAAADVYALGAMLYEALTGRPPFQAPDALQTLFLVLSTDPVSPKTLQPKLSADLNTICMKCLEKAPKKRYATAGELADDLRRWQKGEPIVARPVGRIERAVKWARRNKAGAALVGVSVLLVLAVIAFGVWESFNAAKLKEANDQLANKNGELEDANRKLTEAKAESDRSYGLAANTLDEIVRDTTLKLNGMPNGETLLLDLLARQTGLYRQLSEVRPADETATTARLNALMMRSSYETSYGRHEAAARTRAELREAVQTALARTPDAPDLRAREVRLAFDTASDAQFRRQKDEASAARAEFLRLAGRFVEQFPAHRDATQFRVQGHWLRGFDAAARGDTPARVKALEDAVAAARDSAEPVTRFTLLSSSLSQLATVLTLADRPDDADAAYAQAEELYAAGSPIAPKEGEVCRGGIAEAKGNRAQIALNAGRLADARKLYGEAEPVLRQLVRDFPLTVNHRLNLAAALFWQGVLLQKDDPAKCRERMDEAIGLLDDELARRPNADLRSIRDNYAAARKKLPPPEKK